MKKQKSYKRVLLKLSGEALQGGLGYGIDPQVVDSIANQLKEVKSMGVELAVVIGGGNIFRGLQAASRGMDRSTADYMGMLATVINGMALQDALERKGVFTVRKSFVQCHRREVFEIIGSGDEIGFAIGLNKRRFFTIHFCENKSFFGFTPGALGGRRDPFFS